MVCLPGIRIGFKKKKTSRSHTKTTEVPCLICGIPSTISCSVCKTAYYCGDGEHENVRSYAQCQLFVPNSSLSPSPFRLQDWQSHEEHCSKVKAAGANTFDAILFAAKETKPRLVKIPWKMGQGNRYHILDTDVWFKNESTSVRELFFHRLGINGPKLGRGLCLVYDDNFSMNGSFLNRCIIAATGGKAGHQWCGNVLALRMESLRSLEFYASVDMEQDLRLFVTYLEEYGKVKPTNTQDHYGEDAVLVVVTK